MKTIFTALAVLALANLVAIAGFVGWLRTSGRLSEERFRRIREVLASTIEEEARAAAEAERARQAAESERAERDRMAVPPEGAQSKIERAEQADQVRLQHILRQQREVEDLKRSLDRERRELTQAQEEFSARLREFDAYRARLAEIEGTEQFRKALTTLQAQKPADARRVLDSLIAQGQTDQVIAYLSEMDERARNRVVAEFAKADPGVAADLLEKLRTRGVEPTSAAGVNPGARAADPGNPRADASQPDRQ